MTSTNLSSSPTLPTPELPTAPRTRKLVWGMLGTLFLLGIAAWGLLGKVRGNEPPDAPVAADVPRVEGEHIVFSSAFAERIGLRTQPVRQGTMTPVISAVGTVTLDPAHVAAVGARMRGLVRRIHRFEGDAVEAGEVLAEVDSAELGEAQASITMLEAEREAARLNAEREQQLKERRLSTAREAEVANSDFVKYDAMLRAASQRVAALGGAATLRNHAAIGKQALRSPIAGTVIDRHVAVGQSVEADLVGFRIANLDHLWVELAVFEGSLAQMRTGDRVDLHPFGENSRVIPGRIAHVGARIDPDTRSASVRIEVDNQERHLRPGQSVTAEIHSTQDAERTALLVPTSAVVTVDGQNTVFVAESETRVRAVPVTLGVSSGHEHEIKAGLEAGQRVVSKGVFALKSELFR